MSQFTIEDREVQIGDYYSPGFYMQYWDNGIVKHLPAKAVLGDNRLKKYRELWIGSILAAAQSKSRDDQYYVGLPPDEPPDIELAVLSNTKTASGRSGLEMNLVPVEIVRCDVQSGETLASQIALKNEPAYSNYIVAVYVHGGNPTDLAIISDQLKKTKVYPVQISMVAQAVETESGILLPDPSYLVETIYPKRAQTIVSRNDTKAFFSGYNIISKRGRGIQPKPEFLGRARLLLPKL
jgi:hypothetical protein